MSLSFTQALEQAELLARQALPPEVHERLSCAVALVQDGAVFQNADGTWSVQSATQPDKRYTVNGSCTCEDAFYRAPEGRCKHKLAQYLARKAMALMAQPTPVVAVPVEPWPDNDVEGGALTARDTAPQGGSPRIPLPEAPVSITLKASLHGHEVLVTLRGHDFASVRAQVEAASQWLQATAPAVQETGKEWCRLHKVKLHLNHGKDGKTWLSHRLPEGGFCKGGRRG